jgi:AhpD family alkylhydroperoxidase
MDVHAARSHSEKGETMDKLAETAQKRKIAHRRLTDLGSKVYDRFLEMERATYSEGVLPKKVKELIAVGISVQINCESCMQWHIEQAASSGANLHEIVEAVEVGIEMGGGPATVSARFALDVLAKLFPEAVH